MKKFLPAGAVIALLASISPASAWFDMGHMTIAAAAYAQLSPTAREKIAQLLKLNPDYDTWVAGVPGDRREIVAFTHASTWADDIKSRPDDYHRSTAAADGDHAGDNIGYADRLMHAYWHFLDLPFAPDGTPPQDPESPNALTQIQIFRNTLSSDASDDVKSYDLVWLLHLVGDAHQPLHATSRFTRHLPRGDNGGNAEKLCNAFTCDLKLHAYWDGLLGDRGGPEEAIDAASHLGPPDATRAAIDNPKTWFQESAALAKENVYTDAIGDGTGPFTLPDDYQANASSLARSQAAIAGARLARLLNTAFDQ